MFVESVEKCGGVCWSAKYCMRNGRKENDGGSGKQKYGCGEDLLGRNRETQTQGTW